MPESLKEVFARGYRARAENDLAEARAAFLEAVRRASLETDRPALAEALCGLAQAERGIGNPGAAIHQYANAALLYRELGSRERFAYAIRHEADILRETGKTTEAKPRYLEAEEIYRQLGDRATLDLANTLRGLALASKGIDASKPSGRRHVSFTKNAKSRLASMSVTANFLNDRSLAWID